MVVATYRGRLMRALAWLPLLLTVLLTVAAAGTLVASRANVRANLVEHDQARTQARALTDLRTALLDAETGQRGYLLTANPRYLEPSRRGSARVDAALDTVLGGSGSTDTLPPGFAGELRASVDAKIAELRETLRLHDAGQRDAALALVNTDAGQRDMERIRSILETAIDTQEALANSALARVTAARERVALTLIALLVLMSILLVWTLANAASARRAALAERSLALSEEARERIELLARELDHRMKNIFAVASGLLRQTARGKGEDVRRFAESVDGRLVSMSHAYQMTRPLGEPRTLTGRQIVDEVVRGQILDGHGFEVGGPPVTVVEDAVTPIALVLHELTTNALKYGAWRDGDVDGNGDEPSRGSNDNADTRESVTAALPGVRVSWRTEAAGDFVLDWDETLPAPNAANVPEGDDSAASEGFGSRLMRNCARQLGGELRREWQDGALRVSLRAPRERVVAAAPPAA